MPRPKQRTPQLRRRILDIALELLVTEGVSSLTTRRVAELANTSPPAIYELFAHKEGLLRGLFYEGFERLLTRFEALSITNDPLDDVRAMMSAFRAFATDNPALFGMMYNRPFDTFGPGQEELELGEGTRRFFVDRVQRCVAAGAIAADAVDVAHGLLALAIGLATQENAGWLGRSPATRARRWALAVDLLLSGHSADRSSRRPKARPARPRKRTARAAR